MVDMGSANVEMVSRCLPPRAIGLERLAQGRTNKLISVFVHSCHSSTRVYIYVTCPNSYAVRRIMIALMSLPWENPWIRQCYLLCCSYPLYKSTPTAQCRVTQARAQTGLLDDIPLQDCIYQRHC